MATDVLLVESDERFLAEMTDTFRAAGISVLATSDGDEAFALAEVHAPRLIVLTVEARPGKPSGFTLCRKFRQTPDFAEVPIFILGAAVTEEVFEQHRRHRYPADEYFRKPVHPSELLISAAHYVSFGETVQSDTPGESDMGMDLELDSLLSLDDLDDMDMETELTDTDEEDYEPLPESPTVIAPPLDTWGAMTGLPPDVASFRPMSSRTSAVTSRGEAAVPDLAVTAEMEDPGNRKETSDDAAALPVAVHIAADDPRVAYLEERLTALSAALDESRGTLTSREIELGTLRRELADARSSDDGLRTRLEALERQLNEQSSSSALGSSTAREMLTLRTQLNRAESEMLKFKDEIFAREHRILELQETLEARSAEQTRAAEALGAAEARTGDLEAQVRELTLTIQSSQQSLQERDQQLTNMQGELNAAGSQVELLRQELQASQQSWASESASFERRLAELLESERQSREQITLLVQDHQSRLAAADAEFSRARAVLEATLEELRVELGASEGRSTELSHELTRAREQIGSLDAVIADLRSRSIALESELDNQIGLRRTLETQVNRRESEIAAAQANLTDALGDAARLATELEHAVARGSETQSRLEVAIAATQQVQAVLDDKETALASTSATLRLTEDEVLKLSEQLAEASTLESQLRSELQSTSDSLHQQRLFNDETTSRLNAATQRVESLHGELAASKARETVAAGEITTLSVGKLAAEREAASLSERVTSLRASLAAFARVSEAAADAVSTLMNELAAVRRNEQSLREHVAAQEVHTTEVREATALLLEALDRSPARFAPAAVDTSMSAHALQSLGQARESLTSLRVQTGPQEAMADDGPSHTPLPDSPAASSQPWAPTDTMPEATLAGSGQASRGVSDDFDDQEGELVELESDLVDLDDL